MLGLNRIQSLLARSPTPVRSAASGIPVVDAARLAAQATLEANADERDALFANLATALNSQLAQVIDGGRAPQRIKFELPAHGMAGLPAASAGVFDAALKAYLEGALPSYRVARVETRPSPFLEPTSPAYQTTVKLKVRGKAKGEISGAVRHAAQRNVADEVKRRAAAAASNMLPSVLEELAARGSDLANGELRAPVRVGTKDQYDSGYFWVRGADPYMIPKHVAGASIYDALSAELSQRLGSPGHVHEHFFTRSITFDFDPQK
jgi:hypothetical protein